MTRSHEHWCKTHHADWLCWKDGCETTWYLVCDLPPEAEPEYWMGEGAESEALSSDG